MPAELTPRFPASRSDMRYLHELLGEYEDKLLDGWDAVLRQESTQCAGAKVRESLLPFLIELRAALRRATMEGAYLPTSPKTDGNGRDDPGADLDPLAATRAYGFLHLFILEIAAERGIEVSLAEQRALAWHLNEAVVQAVAWYLRRQDRESHRIAHELRNPLGSAKMALTLLRSRADLGDHARLAEMLDRNLQRLEHELDGGLARGRLCEPEEAPPPDQD